MMYSVVVLASLVGVSLGWLVGSSNQLTVSGELLCDSARDGDKAWIRLYDKDRMGVDDTMEEKMVSFRNGKVSFSLSNVKGAVDSLGGRIDPYFKVYHNCGDSRLSKQIKCQRRYKTELNQDKLGGQIDMGRINLENKGESEERDCNMCRQLGWEDC